MSWWAVLRVGSTIFDALVESADLVERDEDRLTVGCGHGGAGVEADGECGLCVEGEG